MDSNIKQINVTVPSGAKGGNIERKVSKRKSGGGAADEMTGLSVPIEEIVRSSGGGVPAVPVREPPVAAAAPALAPAAHEGGAASAAAAQPLKRKIVLAPKKKITKIMLTKKRHVSERIHHEVPHKPVRKITLGLVGHKRRITRARRLHKESHEMPIADVRAALVSKGVIKTTSKAPDAILRQLYRDTMSLAQPAL